MKPSTRSSSVDPREVAHYQALAETWWDKSGPFWPLHQLNQLRIGWIEQQLTRLGMTVNGPQPFSGLKVLDVGCGGGILSESLAKLGASVTAIDVVERNIQIARHHAQGEGLNIDYRHQTVESLADTGIRFDVVFNMEVVEHVADLSSFMTACNQLVRPGGATFIATINRNPLAWLVAIIGAEYILRWLPRGTHHYAMLRKPDELADCLAEGELRVQQLTGVGANPFNRRLFLSRSKYVNYMLVATRAAPVITL